MLVIIIIIIILLWNCQINRKYLFQKSPLQVEMYIIALQKDLLYLSLRHRTALFEKLKVISLCWISASAFLHLTQYFSKKMLQLVLWNKWDPLKEQGYNGFPEINILSNFFSNQPQIAYYNGWLQKVLRNEHSFLDMSLSASAPVKKISLL